MLNENIYERLGVPTIINAKGPSTRVSGGIMDSAVADAMRAATGYCVDMTALQGRASEIVASVTGAEAGYVTNGAASALLLGTAACVTGLDPARMNKLPCLDGMRNEVVIVRSQRNFYDHAVRAVGVELVEVGIADRFSGAGVRDAEAWEIADAINERTACVFYVAQPHSRPALSDVASVAHAAGVPVLVDAAAQLPPIGNLRALIEAGADLVAFSGGKAINGPQASGILCGRQELIAAAALHNLDHDIHFEQWVAPSFIDKSRLRGLPQHGIGRACKVGKEQIVGLLVALQQFDEESVARRYERSNALLTQLVAELDPALPVSAELGANPSSGEPRVTLALEESEPMGALDLAIALQNGTPSIQVDTSQVHAGAIRLVASHLADGDVGRIAGRLNSELNPAQTG